jgi:hypothetical protein
MVEYLWPVGYTGSNQLVDSGKFVYICLLILIARTIRVYHLLRVGEERNGKYKCKKNTACNLLFIFGKECTEGSSLLLQWQGPLKIFLAHLPSPFRYCLLLDLQ